MKQLTVLLAVCALMLMIGCSDQQESPLQTDNMTTTTEPSVDQQTAPTGEIAVPEFAQLEADVKEEISSDRQSPLSSQGWWWNTISSPTTITSPGIYRVTSDFSAEGDAIVIQSSHVVLLLGNRTITGPGPKAGRGIVIEGGNHVHIVGGTLTNFGIGVAGLGANWSSVRGLHVDGADEFADPGAGIMPQIGIMMINGSHNRIFFNCLRDINLGTFMRGGNSSRNQIYLNSIMGGDMGLLGICYNPAPGEGADAPDNDKIFLNYVSRFGAGIQFKEEAGYNKVKLNWIGYFNAPWEDLNGTNQFGANHTVQLTN